MTVDIQRTGVGSALEELRRIGLDALLEKYGGPPSTRWYVEAGNQRLTSVSTRRFPDEGIGGEVFQRPSNQRRAQKQPRRGAGTCGSPLAPSSSWSSSMRMGGLIWTQSAGPDLGSRVARFAAQSPVPCASLSAKVA